MCGGGGSTTNVTETGLGDDQYDALVENQGFIRDDIASGVQAGQDRFDDVDDTLEDGFGATQDRFDTVEESLTGISGDLETGFADVITAGETLATDVDSRLTQTDENIDTGFTTLGESFDTGVETINTNVDARAGELSDTLDTRFDTVDDTLETEFGGLDTRLDTDFENVMTGQEEGFTAVGEQLTDAETNLSGQLTDTQGKILDATTVVKDLVEKYGGDASLYYEALAQGQSDLLTGQGTMQDAFDSFRTDYDDNTTLANQARADLASTVVGGFETVNETLGNQGTAIGDVASDVAGVQAGVDDVAADVVSGAETTEENFGDVARGLSGISDDVEGVSGQVTDFEDDTEANFGTVATDIASGEAATSTEAEANRSAFKKKLNDVREILQDDNVSLDANVADVYTDLANSFDETGTLITETVTGSGTTITRALSDQGELFIKEIAANGATLDQQTLDINSLLSNVDTFQTEVQTQFIDIFGDATAAAESRTTILSAFDTTSNLISQLGTSVSADLADNFTALSNAFDATGNLIRSDIDANGNKVTRELDAAGNLITTSIDANGNVLNESVTDIASLSTQMNQLQNGLGDQLVSAFDGIQQSSDELKVNLIGNLNGLKNIMQTQGGNLSEELTDKFTALSASFDENGDLVRSAVDENGDFVFREINKQGELVINTVDDATGRLIESDKFNAKLLTEDLDSKFGSTEEFLQAIDRSMTQFGDDFQQGLLGMASGLDEGFAARFDELEEGQKTSQDLFKDRLTQVKALLEEDVADLDDGLRNRMTALSNAFDGEGRLIANAIDANGNLLQRQIDEQGNLILTTFSRLNGRALDQQALSIDRMINEIGNRSFMSGSNANMGGRSPTQGAPAPASVYSGFASPYAQTI